jgi:hypothetical protein
MVFLSSSHTVNASKIRMLEGMAIMLLQFNYEYTQVIYS